MTAGLRKLLGNHNTRGKLHVSKERDSKGMTWSTRGRTEEGTRDGRCTGARRKVTLVNPNCAKLGSALCSRQASQAHARSLRPCLPPCHRSPSSLHLHPALPCPPFLAVSFSSVAVSPASCMSPPPSLLHLTLASAVHHIHRLSDLSAVPDHLVLHLFHQTLAQGKLTDHVLQLFLATGNDDVHQLVKALRIRPVIKPILPTRCSEKKF